MRYVEARIETTMRDETYRIYITDVLKGLVGINVRYADLLPGSTKNIENPEEKAEEIKEGMKEKLKRLGG